MSKAGSAEETEVHVLREDQERINKFGRLNTIYHDLEERIKISAKECDVQDDANDELMLADEDEPILYSYGDCFVELEKQEAEELVEKNMEKEGERKSDMETKLGEIDGEMKKLKALLYAKFGDQIYLEEE